MPIDVAGPASKKKGIEKILGEMQGKLSEIDALRKELEDYRQEEITAEQSLAMLEEIKVPSLEAIREEKKKAA